MEEIEEELKSSVLGVGKEKTLTVANLGMGCVIIVRGMLANGVHANTPASWKVQEGATVSLTSSKCNIVS